MTPAGWCRRAGLARFVMVTLLLTGCTAGAATPATRDTVAPSPPTLGPSAAGAPAAGLSAPSSTVALTWLDALAVRPPAEGDYDRAAYGRRWADVDGNRCNQRDDVLLRDAHRGTAVVRRQGRCDHDVLAGTWTDPYTGRRVTLTDLKDRRQAAALQIEHVVALAEAHRSGAAGWTARRRELFANDLAALRAIDGDLNTAKFDRDPAQWQPAPPARCAYARAYIGIKHTWQLAVDDDEKAALRDMVQSC